MKTLEETKKGLECCIKANETLECPRECPYYREDCNSGALPYQDFSAYTKQLEAQIPRWIPVEERLPEDGQGTLVICRDGYITTMAYEYERWWWQGTEDQTVTHWMPLPEPPSEKKGE